MKISEQHPPPHSKYVVLRNGFFFTATPCYGLHAPWWVVRLMGDDASKHEYYEADAIPMKLEDEWWPLETFKELVLDTLIVYDNRTLFAQAQADEARALADEREGIADMAAEAEGDGEGENADDFWEQPFPP